MNEDEITAPEYVRIPGIKTRYVTKWAKNGEVAGARPIDGGEKCGGIWIASRSAWIAPAAKDRRVARTKQHPRSPERPS